MDKALSIIAGAVLALALIGVHVWQYRRDRGGDWHPYSTDQMRRRRLDGSWETRPATDDEIERHHRDIGDRNW